MCGPGQRPTRKVSGRGRVPDGLIDHARPDLGQAPAQRHRATFDACATAHLLIATAARYPAWEALTAAAVPPGLPGASEPGQQQTVW